MPSVIQLFEHDSPEYEEYIDRLSRATTRQNRRNLWTNAKREGRKLPNGPTPCKPTKTDYAAIKTDRDWKAEIGKRSERKWVASIRKCIEEKFYLSKVSCIIWWDRCEEQTLDKKLWDRLAKDYDFERDIETDWDLVEYALHCCGYPPLKARQLAFENKNRKEFRAHRKLVFKCSECADEVTGLNTAPVACGACGAWASMEQVDDELDDLMATEEYLNGDDLNK